ncbi:MAG: serine hydrolase [Succinivibrio sp.]|nr:serine hydrolase [Succinivibrio sp.]
MQTLKSVLKGALVALALCAVSAQAAPKKAPAEDPFAQLKANAATAQGAAAPLPQNSSGAIVLPDPPVFNAKAWLLMDYRSGRVVTGHNIHERIWPASLTKMMTSYVIGNELMAGRLHLDDEVTIAEAAWSKRYTDSSKMFIEVGKSVKVGDLYRGIIIQSGNDACVAMALHLAGSEEGFVSVMNTYAKQLGLNETHFANVHGLFDEQNYSTAYDMALLGRALIHDQPEEYAIYKEKEFTFNGIKQYNRNRLLWDKELNADGIKTGHLSQVGYNLVSSAVQGDMRLIAAVIGANSDKERAAFNKALLNYGFHYFEEYMPFKADQTLLTREVRLGNRNKVNIGLQEDLGLLIPRGSKDKVKATYRLARSVFTAPINEGDELGQVEIKYGDKLLGTAPLVARESIAEGGFFSRTWDKVTMFFSSSDEEGETAAADTSEAAGSAPADKTQETAVQSGAVKESVSE